MKLSTILTALLIAAAPSLFAQTEDHSAHHPATGATAEAESSAPTEHEHAAGKPNALQENMKTIESLMQQIQQTNDPARKRELLGAHLAALQQQLRLMLAQDSSMRMSMKEGGKTDAPPGDSMMKGGMMKGGGMMMMHKRVEQRIDMLERLLQQLIEREAVEAELGSR